MKSTGVCGGFSGGWINYARAGRPLGMLRPQWRHFLEKDREGQIYLCGKLLEVHPDMAAAYTLSDIERNLEIRVLAWVWIRIREGDTADQLWSLPDALRSTSLIADVPLLRIERTLFQLLKDASPREIFVITSRLVYDYAHHATGDAAPRDILWMKPLPAKWNRKKEPYDSYLRRHFGTKDGSDCGIVPPAKESLFRLVADHPGFQLANEQERKEFVAWKNLDDQAFRATKYGARISGTGPVRGLKRWYTFGKVLGVSNRMASYWKKRTDTKYQEVVLELRKEARTTAPNEKRLTLEEEIGERFHENEQHGNPFA